MIADATVDKRIDLDEGKVVFECPMTIQHGNNSQMDDCKVTYRLGSPYGQILEQRADEVGISRHMYARLALVQTFEASVQHAVKDQVLALRAEVGLLRHQVERLNNLLTCEQQAEDE